MYDPLFTRIMECFVSSSSSFQRVRWRVRDAYKCRLRRECAKDESVDTRRGAPYRIIEPTSAREENDFSLSLSREALIKFFPPPTIYFKNRTIVSFIRSDNPDRFLAFDPWLFPIGISSPRRPRVNLNTILGQRAGNSRGKLDLEIGKDRRKVEEESGQVSKNGLRKRG